MKLYNSASKKIEDFIIRDNHARIYVCGVTPYDTTHLGHAFTYTVNDILIRYLESQGVQVTYVQNVTDIDDDILRKARETGEDWRALGNRWTRHFLEDLKTINVRPPDYYPRATGTIPEIVAMVEKLLAAGVAYENQGSVYFEIDAWDRYGSLSCLSREEMLPIANQRGNKPDDPKKRHPLDFVLWQAQAPDEPAWDSPWGAGRPGWHIECSAMSTKYLGETIDVHSGGGDLLYPHHESEIAQVEPLTGEPFVRFWLHVAMVRYIGEKMSKSLGNLVMVRDLLKRYPAGALRLYLASFHYRQVWDFVESDLGAKAELYTKLLMANSLPGGTNLSLDGEPWRVQFTEALANDLDTPRALSLLEELADFIILRAGAGSRVQDAQKTLRELAGVFGARLGASEPEERVMQGWNRHLQDFV